MSLVGQVDWYFQVTVCARDTCGMATAAPAGNLRRVAVLDTGDRSVLMGVALLWLRRVCWRRSCAEPLGDMNRPDRFPIPVRQVVRGDITAHKARIVSPRDGASACGRGRNDGLDSAHRRPLAGHSPAGESARRPRLYA